MDSNHRRRKPADLQSAPFGHSGICPPQNLRGCAPLSDCSCRSYRITYPWACRWQSYELLHCHHSESKLSPAVNEWPRDSYRIQTYNLLIRSQMLYSVELTSLLHIYHKFKNCRFQKIIREFANSWWICGRWGECLGDIPRLHVVGAEGFEPPTLCL